jgi:hypothetical protein
MISVTTVPGIGKHHVLTLVITDPLPTAFRLDQVPRFAAQTTPRDSGNLFSFPLSFLSLPFHLFAPNVLFCLACPTTRS